MASAAHGTDDLISPTLNNLEHPEPLDIPDKVLKFEQFVNEDLRAKLFTLGKARNDLCEEIQEYNTLRGVIEKLTQANPDSEPLKTMVDLGCNFYVKAKVSDPSRIFVAVGFGFFLEFTFDEALRFIDKKVALFNEKLTVFSNDIALLKAQIKLVLGGLKELQDIQE